MANVNAFAEKLMRSFLQACRMKGWDEVDHALYAKAYERFGGSVLSHPQVLEAISTVVGLPVQYYAYRAGGELQAVIPVWKKWIAGSKLGLKKMSCKGVIDFGNTELILPIDSNAEIKLPVMAGNLSNIHSKNITNLAASDMSICLSKSHVIFSKKFRYNRKRECRLLEEQGGVIKSVASLSNNEIVDMYIHLFELRWGFKPTGCERLLELLGFIRPLLFGSVIEMDGHAIAFQLIYKIECANHISMEYINGGVDPAYKALSPGSVLTYVNTREAWEYANSQEKQLRYSFGLADNEYKDRWCSQSPIYSI